MEQIIVQISGSNKNNNWHTRHDEKQYIYYFNELKCEIERQIPGSIVLKDSKSQMWAFEVSHNNNLLFSKLITQQFPDIKTLTHNIQQYLTQLSEGKNIEKYLVMQGNNLFLPQISQQNDKYSTPSKEMQGGKSYRMKEVSPVKAEKNFRTTVQNPFSNNKRTTNNVKHFSPRKHMRFYESTSLTPFFDPSVRRKWMELRGEKMLGSSNRLRDRFLSVNAKMMQTMQEK